MLPGMAAGGGPLAAQVGTATGVLTGEVKDEQKRQLDVLADTLDAQNAAQGKTLQGKMNMLGANVDGRQMIAMIRPRMEAQPQRPHTALAAAKALLTAEQWNYLPDRTKTPRGFGGGPGDGERRPRGGE